VQARRAVLVDGGWLARIARPADGLSLLDPKPEQEVAPVPGERDGKQSTRDISVSGSGRKFRGERGRLVRVVAHGAQPGEQHRDLIAVRCRANGGVLATVHDHRTAGAHHLCQ